MATPQDRRGKRRGARHNRRDGNHRRGGAGRRGESGSELSRGIRRRGQAAPSRAKATLAELDDIATTLRKVIAQTNERLAGGMPDGAERVVSFHDKDARPIRKGRLGVPVEFGFKAQVLDNRDGVVLDYEVMKGNPADAPLLVPAVRRIKALFGQAPRAVTADRGYGEARVDAELTAVGVKKVAIPRKGKPSASRKKAEAAPGFRKLVKWRTGSEGRIASLKRGYGWSRSLMDGTAGTSTWCGWGIFASNATKIAHLAATAANPLPPSPKRPRPPHGSVLPARLGRPTTNAAARRLNPVPRRSKAPPRPEMAINGGRNESRRDEDRQI